MTSLKLGVLDLPYAEGASYKAAGKRKPKHMSNSTTGDVAEILEGKYHVMEVFAELHGDEIAADIADSYMGAVESLQMGAPMTLDPAGEAMGKIKERFDNFITNKEMDSLGIPGVPTLASLEGHSKRFKHPYAKRSSRPSFIDTGLYEGSFIPWID